MNEVGGVVAPYSTCETEGMGEGSMEMLRGILCASRAGVSRRSGAIVELDLRLIACYIHLQQYLSEVLVLVLRPLQIVFVKLWIELFEVLQPEVQLPDNEVQPLKKICPVVFHPNPPKVFLHRDLHLIETPERVTTRHIAGDVEQGADR
jgi:hypothetical protein